VDTRNESATRGTLYDAEITSTSLPYSTGLLPRSGPKLRTLRWCQLGDSAMTRQSGIHDVASVVERSPLMQAQYPNDGIR